MRDELQSLKLQQYLNKKILGTDPINAEFTESTPPRSTASEQLPDTACCIGADSMESSPILVFHMASTYLLFHGGWINKCHQVYRKVTNHISLFTSVSDFEAQRTENLGIH